VTTTSRRSSTGNCSGRRQFDQRLADGAAVQAGKVEARLQRRDADRTRERVVGSRLRPELHERYRGGADLPGPFGVVAFERLEQRQSEGRLEVPDPRGESLGALGVQRDGVRFPQSVDPDDVAVARRHRRGELRDVLERPLHARYGVEAGEVRDEPDRGIEPPEVGNQREPGVADGGVVRKQPPLVAVGVVGRHDHDRVGAGAPVGRRQVDRRLRAPASAREHGGVVGQRPDTGLDDGDPLGV